MCTVLRATAAEASMVSATMAAMVVLATLASLWIARKTVNMPVVQALAHT